MQTYKRKRKNIFEGEEKSNYIKRNIELCRNRGCVMMMTKAMTKMRTRTMSKTMTMIM
jgi:hypothetical protein